MQRLEVSGAVRHIYIYVIRRLKVRGGGARLSVKRYCRIILFAVLPRRIAWATGNVTRFTKKNCMGCWECNTFGGMERCVVDFGGETRGK
jgi:hypothetical protein